MRGFCEIQVRKECRFMLEYVLIFVCLLIGFGLLFQRIRWLEFASDLLRRTKAEVTEVSRKRLLEDRRNLLMLKQEHNLWYYMERQLHYSGWKRRMPFLTAELWVLGNVMAMAMVFLLGSFLFQDWIGGCVCILLLFVVEYLLLRICKSRENRSVNKNLLEFLNFLGNYSITAGEVTGIFQQISKYVDAPLKSVLEECGYEAQTTGDASMALLAMAEKVEHPKFKELVHNLEVSVRYCADFKVLVDSSRRSVREYLRMGEERKGMLREAVINMIMLVAMSLFALFAVDGLIDRAIWEIVLYTIPGRIAVGIVVFIWVLMGRQMLMLEGEG